MSDELSGFAHQLHAELMPLTEALHESFGSARSDMERSIPPYKHAGSMATLKSAFVRAGVREHLSYLELGEWKLTGNPEMMGQLSLLNTRGGIELRVLKSPKRRNEIPHAGSNSARRAYWRNVSMLEIGQQPLSTELQLHKMLLLWTLNEDESVALRVVRPLREGKFMGSVETDFVMELAPLRSDFEKLIFQGEPDIDEDLFTEDLNEEGETGSGFGG